MISIAMATYNGEKYIRDQVDSILNQTFQDFEVIICDDCSTDDTFSILEMYANKDSRITIFKNRRNLGFKQNFEIVIKKCKGEFIALSDQDDIWLPQHLEILIEAMGQNTQVVCGYPVFVDSTNKELPERYNYFKMLSVPKNDKETASHIFLCRSTFQGASMLIRRSFFEKALPIPEEAKYHDSWFAILACFTGGLKYVDKPVMRYRRHENSITLDSLRPSAARRFFAVTFLNHTAKDRLCFINSIRQRVGDLTAEQVDFLNCMERMIKRCPSIIGRIMNLPYMLTNFEAIFSCGYKDAFRI